MAGEILGAIQGMKSAMDLGKALLAANVDFEVKKQLMDMQHRLLSAYNALLDAQSDVETARRELADLRLQMAQRDGWETDKQRYKLIALGAGSTVYALKSGLADGEPPHYLCVSCYNASKKSILQAARNAEKWTVFRCNTCKAEWQTNSMGPIPATFA